MKGLCRVLGVSRAHLVCQAHGKPEFRSVRSGLLTFSFSFYPPRSRTSNSDHPPSIILSIQQGISKIGPYAPARDCAYARAHARQRKTQRADRVRDSLTGRARAARPSGPSSRERAPAGRVGPARGQKKARRECTPAGLMKRACVRVTGAWNSARRQLPPRGVVHAVRRDIAARTRAPATPVRTRRHDF